VAPGSSSNERLNGATRLVCCIFVTPLPGPPTDGRCLDPLARQPALVTG
jgi:hypothetical protein